MVRPIYKGVHSNSKMSAEERLEKFRRSMKTIKEIAPSTNVAKTELLYYGDKMENFK